MDGEIKEIKHKRKQNHIHIFNSSFLPFLILPLPLLFFLTKMDVAAVFFEKVKQREYQFVVSSGAFKSICGTKMQGDLNLVTETMYYADGNEELQLVWRDVLERVENTKYEAKTVQNLKMTKTQQNGSRLYGTFGYKKTAYFFDRVDKTWTLCRLDEN